MCLVSLEEKLIYLHSWPCLYVCGDFTYQVDTLDQHLNDVV